jgi:hypothetical protein
MARRWRCSLLSSPGLPASDDASAEKAPTIAAGDDDAASPSFLVSPCSAGYAARCSAPCCWRCCRWWTAPTVTPGYSGHWPGYSGRGVSISIMWSSGPHNRLNRKYHSLSLPHSHSLPLPLSPSPPSRALPLPKLSISKSFIST